jgi:hypothetical protein
MAKIKISELIPKGAPLSTTDLLMISQETSDGFESNSITGAEIIESAQEGLQRTLVSGTNIKTVNSTSLLGSGDIAISTNPKLLGFSGKIGTQTSGTAVTICHSVLIPANTLTTNSILQIVFRMYRQNGNVGQMYGRIYFNTSNSLTGASLFNTTFTMNGGGTQYLGLVERNLSYNGTTLIGYSNVAFSEFTTGTALTTAMNRTVDNYVLLTMACQNSADIANIDIVKVFAYV